MKSKSFKRLFYCILIMCLLVVSINLYANGAAEGERGIRSVISKKDTVSRYLQNKFSDLSLTSGPFELTAIPLTGELLVLSEYSEMKARRLTLERMKEELRPQVLELNEGGEKIRKFLVTVKYDGSNEEGMNSLSLNSSFFDYMFLDNDKGDFLRVSDYTINGYNNTVGRNNDFLVLIVEFGESEEDVTNFFNSAKEIYISITYFGFEGEQVAFELPIAEMYNDLPEDPKQIITALNSTKTIYFDTQGGESIPNQLVEIGDLVEEPIKPVKHGSMFNGWYKDPLYENEWIFSKDTAAEDLTLFASWEPLLYSQLTPEVELPDSYIAYGGSVSISGEYAMVGAPKWSYGHERADKGIVFVFERNSSSDKWKNVGLITPPIRDDFFDYHSGESYLFGNSVSIDGSYAVIGDPEDTERGTRAGNAFIVERNDTTGDWEIVKQLVPPLADQDDEGYYDDMYDEFGSAVDISGDIVIVGADGYGANGYDEGGCAYIFERDDTGHWRQTQKLIPDDVEAYDAFGSDLSIDGNRAIIKSNVRAYIFSKNKTTNKWEQTEKFEVPEKMKIKSVAINGNNVFVGAFKSYGATDMAFFYESETDGTWKMTETVAASDTAKIPLVSISGDYAVLGLPYDGLVGRTAGAICLLEKKADEGSWVQVAKIGSPTGSANRYFGQSVSINEDSVIVGGQGIGVSGRGGVLVFSLETIRGVE